MARQGTFSAKYHELLEFLSGFVESTPELSDDDRHLRQQHLTIRFERDQRERLPHVFGIAEAALSDSSHSEANPC
jgi:hypothetical protein